MQPLERSLRSGHEAFVSGLSAKVRGVVAESWGRSLATGVAPDALCPPFVFEHDELTDYRAAHPLSAVFPLLYDVLGRAAEDCDSVMAVGDADGRLLWVSGRPAVLRRAESINFAEGAWWDESHAGTNAPGVALKLGEPVLIRSGEHYAVPVQRWSCAAAPIHDPVSNTILGVVDVTGSAEAGSPQSLAMVRSAARMAEAELGRLILLRSVGATRSPSTALKAALLGRPDCEVRLDGRTIRLSLRHSEILALLVDHPEGLTGEQLALEVYGEDVQGSTVRAEILRLRALLGEQLLGSRPYRLLGHVDSDWSAVTADLDKGLVRSALRHYAGPLLPQSEAPGVITRRDRLEHRMRQAVLSSHDPDLLAAWTRTRWGVDDLEGWERLVRLLPATSPLRAMARGEVDRLRVEYGLGRI